MTGWGQDGPARPAAPATTSPTSPSPAPCSDRRAGRPAARPRQPARGLRRRLALPRHRRARRPAERARTRRAGQVVDAAIVDGAAHLLAMIHGMLAAGRLAGPSGAPTSSTAACPFYGTLRDRRRRLHGGRRRWSRSSTRSSSRLLGLDRGGPARRGPGPAGPSCATPIADRFKTATRAEWTRGLRGLRRLRRARAVAARGPATTRTSPPAAPSSPDGVPQPAPAPRFSATQAAAVAPPPVPGQDDPAAIAAGWRTEEAAAESAPGHAAPRTAVLTTARWLT